MFLLGTSIKWLFVQTTFSFCSTLSIIAFIFCIHNGAQRFYVSLDYPFIGASPDGIIHCECHGPRLIEVKCPFTHRGLSIENYSKQKNTCLELKENSVKLKKNHSYFYQVQCQMGVPGVCLCEFYVYTAVDSHIELIEFKFNCN